MRRKGLDAVHTTDYPRAQFLTDAEIREIAISESRIVITKDEDFADYFWAKGSPPRVLLLSTGNIKNNDLIDLFDSNIISLLQLFKKGSDLVIFDSTKIIAY